MSQKSIVKEEQSSQKEGSKSPSFASKEDSHKAYEGENKQDIPVSAPPAASIIRSPARSGYENDPFLETLVRAIEKSPLNQHNNEEEHQLEQSDSSSSSNPPPLVLPPLDTIYDESFLEMVNRAVNQHRRLNSIGSQQLDNTDSQKSFGSILNFGEDEDSNVVVSSQNKDDEDDERRVENPRRAALENIYEEDPLFNFSISGPARSLCFDDKSNELTPSQKFFVLKKNPLYINDLEYVVKSQPVQSQEVDDSQRSVISNQAKLEIVRKPEPQQQQNIDDDLNSSSFSSSQKDFTSWLCFDSHSQLQKFKEITAYDEIQFGEVVVEQKEESYQLCSSQEDKSYQVVEDDEKKLMKEQIFTVELNEDGYSNIDVEKHIINMSTPKRDIVAAGGSAANVSPRAEASTSTLTSSQRHERKTRSGIIYNSLTPESVSKNS